MTATTRNTRIYSRLAGDADLAGLVAMFVEELPDRMATLQRAYAGGDLESLRRTAHQLKGAAGSYGFDQLTPLAAAVESAVREGAPANRIEEALAQLVSACHQVSAGEPASAGNLALPAKSRAGAAVRT